MNLPFPSDLRSTVEIPIPADSLDVPRGSDRFSFLRIPRRIVLLSLAACLCALPSCRTLSRQDPVILPLNSPVQVITSDPVLRDALCRRLSCGEGPELEAEINLSNTSSDVIRNNLLSLATLTMGLWVTHSADVDFRLATRGIERKGTVHVRDGMWFVLPPYMGFLGTNLGTIMNTYRDPELLRHYCIEEEPAGMRRFFDGDHRHMCEEYEHFLDALTLSLTPELLALLSEQKIGAMPGARESP